MANRNVRLVKSNGKKPVIKHFAKTASTALDENSLVDIASGYVAAGADNDTNMLGILRQEVAATDSDYASATKKPVQLIYPGDEIEIDTSAALTVGVSYGIKNAYEVDQADTTNDIFTCTVVLSSTRARGYLKTYQGGNTV